MPRIFDNIDLKLETALKESLEVSYRADFYGKVFIGLRCSVRFNSSAGCP